MESLCSMVNMWWGEVWGKGDEFIDPLEACEGFEKKVWGL